MLENIFILWENCVMATRLGHWRIFQKVSEFLLTKLAENKYAELGLETKVTVHYTKVDDAEKIIKDDIEILTLNDKEFSTIPNVVYSWCPHCERVRLNWVRDYDDVVGEVIMECGICDGVHVIDEEEFAELSQYWEM